MICRSSHQRCFMKKGAHKIFTKYRDLQPQFLSSYYPFFDSCCQETEKFRVNVCFETSEYSVHIAYDNSNLTSKAFQTTFVLFSFKLVLDLNTTATSNQIKNYLTTNRGNFLEMQYGWYRYVLLADLVWLVFERAFTKNSRKAGT